MSGRVVELAPFQLIGEVCLRHITFRVVVGVLVPLSFLNIVDFILREQGDNQRTIRLP